MTSISPVTSTTCTPLSSGQSTSSPLSHQSTSLTSGQSTSSPSCDQSTSILSSGQSTSSPLSDESTSSCHSTSTLLYDHSKSSPSLSDHSIPISSSQLSYQSSSPSDIDTKVKSKKRNIKDEKVQVSDILDLLKVKFTKKNNKIILRFILQALKQLPNEWEENKLFFSGECDTNQTTFEEDSNKLRIGVLARNKTVGRILLSFLRLLFDSNHKIIYYRLSDSFSYQEEEEESVSSKKIKVDESTIIESRVGENKVDEDEITIDEILNEIACCEDDTIYDVNEKSDISKCITTTLSGCDGSYIYSRQLFCVDMWTLERIETTMMQLGLV